MLGNIPHWGVAWTTYVSLIDQSNTKLFKQTPTIAATDFNWYKDGAAGTTLTTAPTIAPSTGGNLAGYSVKIVTSGAEMQASSAVLLCHDVAGAEWCDLAINIEPYQGIRTNVAQAFSATGITLDTNASGTDDFYNYQLIEILAGNGVAQAGLIADYTGASKNAVVLPTWIGGAPAGATSVFTIRPSSVIVLAGTTHVAATIANVASAILAAQLHSGVTIPVVNTAVSATLAAINHAGATIPVVASAVLAAQLHSGVTIPVVNTAISATLAGILHTGATIPVVNTVVSATVAVISANVIDSSAIAASGATEIAAAVWDRAAASHLTAGSFGAGVQPLRTSTAQGGGAAAITLDSSADGTDNTYRDCVIGIIAGTGAGQARLVVSYTGAAKNAVVNPNWITAPDSSSIFRVWENGRAMLVGTTHTGVTVAVVESVLGATVNAMANSVIGAATFASGAINAAAIAASAIGSSELDVSSINAIVDGLLARAVEGGADASGTTKSVGMALGMLGNNRKIAGTTLTVYKSDESTVWYTMAGVTLVGTTATVTEIKRVG